MTRDYQKGLAYALVDCVGRNTELRGDLGLAELLIDLRDDDAALALRPSRCGARPQAFSTRASSIASFAPIAALRMCRCVSTGNCAVFRPFHLLRPLIDRL